MSSGKRETELRSALDLAVDRFHALEAEVSKAECELATARGSLKEILKIISELRSKLSLLRTRQ